MARAKLYTRFGKQIVAAVKKGGPSENSNSALASILAMGKLNNIPRDLIERNIKKASEKDQADFSELQYEAYGLGGVGLVVSCLTDNVNRSNLLVRTAVVKAGGKMADPGSVVFNFKRAGFVVLSGGTEDEVFAAATEAAADDILPRSDGAPGWEVVTEVPSYGAVLAAMKEAGLSIVGEESGLRMVPLVTVAVPDDEQFAKNLALIDKLLEIDDVDAVVINQADEDEA